MDDDSNVRNRVRKTDGISSEAELLGEESNTPDPSETRSGNESDQLPGKMPTRPKPTVSEKRRQQNRQAQKNYREKQKQRLQTLESIIKSREAAHGGSSAFHTVGSDVVSTSSADSSLVNLPLHNGHLHFSHTAPSPGLSTVLDTAGPNYFSSGQHEQHHEHRFTSHPAYRGNAYDDDLALYQNQLSEASFLSASLGGPSTSSQYPPLPASQGGHDVPSRQTTSDAHSHDSSSRDSLADDAAATFLAQFLLQDDVALSRRLIQDIREKRITLKDVLRRGLQSLGESSMSPADRHRLMRSQSHSRLPDPHVDSFRITRMSFIAAMIHNAAIIGLTPPEIYDHDFESPIYTAALSQSTSTQGLFAGLKKDLKPTQNQLAHPHHPYIDLIPFPGFRERVISLLQSSPPVFDQDELCHDLQNGGIICWGSSLGAGVGNSGAPWDIRSWEAQPWFMKKWWMLTGGRRAKCINSHGGGAR
ncbi:hypothetical protein PT974_07406 [Cladobotryum mycophilum]|uniref:BZIP domain-containing protein n=1 Tax=Cladobotryum mycophilum TaxID=491253 RepID=A0ABR0SPD6_9HYPO